MGSQRFSAWLAQVVMLPLAARATPFGFRAEQTIEIVDLSLPNFCYECFSLIRRAEDVERHRFCLSSEGPMMELPTRI